MNVCPSTDRTTAEFLAQGEVNAWYDSQGNINPQNVRLLQDHDNSTTNITLWSVGMYIHDRFFQPRYQMAKLAGWDTTLDDPEQRAVYHFRLARGLENIAPNQDPASPPATRISIAKNKAAELSSEFSHLLRESSEEETLQTFLKENPQMLYPDFIQCHSKFKLGKEYVSDFLFRTQGTQGEEYVFVEIERATKRIFTQADQFSSEFSQAKSQILSWQTWVGENIAYLRQDVPSLYHPYFHLVMGRSHDMSRGRSAMIRNEFANPFHRFSTYDDVLQRFEQIISNLFEP